MIITRAGYLNRIELSNSNHYPAGSPEGRGGQFAPKGTHSSFADLVDASIGATGGGNKLWMEFGKVTPDQANKIKDAIGVDVTDFVHHIDQTHISHIQKDHVGENEKSTGLVPLTIHEVKQIPHFVSTADEIEPGRDQRGNRTLLYRKKIGDQVVVIEEVRENKKRLSVITMYKRRVAPPKQDTYKLSASSLSQTSETIQPRRLTRDAENRESAGAKEIIDRKRNPVNRISASDYKARVISLDRGTRGDEGHFVTIDGRAVFIKDDHGEGVNGRGGSFTKHGLETKLVAHHESRGGNWFSEHRGAMAEDTGGDLHGRSRFTFYRKLPGEVKRHIENNPASRSIFRVTYDTKQAGGADALGSMGDQYWHMVDDYAGGNMNKALESADASDDPEARFHAAVYRELPKERKKQKQGIIPANKLREGHSFTINGRKMEVKSDESNGLMLHGGSDFPETPIHALSEIPIDKYSLKMTRRREAVPDFIPFSRSEYLDRTGIKTKPKLIPVGSIDFASGDDSLPTSELRASKIARLMRDGKEFRPIKVRPKEGGRYVVIDGNARLNAAKKIGREEIECVVITDAGQAENEKRKSVEAHAIGGSIGTLSRTDYIARTQSIIQLSAADLYESATPNLPANTTAGKKLFHYWADVLSVGDWHLPNGRILNVTPQRLERLARNVNLAVSRNVELPICDDHKEPKNGEKKTPRETAEKCRGYLGGAKFDGKTLHLLHSFIGEDSLDVALKNKVSIGIDPDFKDSYGNRYGEAVRHSALTPRPVIHNQRGFVKAA